ncbi:hypothetical protein JNUCC1_00120 [Lentibacillus sp. JNUCC-1]|uniref:hypothetical protein n=1 Tax=Lentibacillus sp. JNUCC-1 TaxID=2654513 RepID=UPI0012E73E32|nr:hypothetical protein [Lentibacillus sp. JNUCC-1]MUV36319.1 hypothetical protein [Lentibacillus sp. JNUCC-1]
MSTGLIIFLVILFAVAVVGTLYAFKQEEKKMKQYEEEGDTPEEELKRSLDYEEESLRSNIPLQIAIYIIAIVLSVVAFLWFIM